MRRPCRVARGRKDASSPRAGSHPKRAREPEGLDVVTSYLAVSSSLELSGDFIDVLDRGDSGVAVICGDVSGHGPNAAAWGRCSARAGRRSVDSGAAPAAIVASLRAVLERERKNPLTFATLCLAWIDPRRNEVTPAEPRPSAAAARRRRGQAAAGARRCPRWGASTGRSKSPCVIAFPTSWRLFFYTDGLIECRMSPGSPERYGEGRLVENLQGLACERIDGACIERLISGIEAVAGEPFQDDVAVMLISKAGLSSQRHVADDRGTAQVSAR